MLFVAPVTSLDPSEPPVASLERYQCITLITRHGSEGLVGVRGLVKGHNLLRYLLSSSVNGTTLPIVTIRSMPWTLSNAIT